MSTKTQKPLPKWFDGTVYKKGDIVSNPYTGDKAELSAEELSMYDVIKGAEFARHTLITLLLRVRLYRRCKGLILYHPFCILFRQTT
jgi:hypothetical protein